MTSAFRFSIARAIGVIFLLAMVLAGMRSGSNDAFKSIYSLTFVMLLYAAIVARYRGPFWHGFAVVGWAYFLFTLGPWMGSPPRPDNRNLISNIIPEILGGVFAANDPPPIRFNPRLASMRIDLLRANREGICNAALTLLFASIGGYAAGRLARPSVVVPPSSDDDRS